MVEASWHDGQLLLECDTCGPMGVSKPGPDAMMTAANHIETHGDDEE